MLRFTLARIRMSRQCVEVALCEISTSPNNTRALFGVGWDDLIGFDVNILYMQRWFASIESGLRIFDVTYLDGWEAKLFGRFTFEAIG